VVRLAAFIAEKTEAWSLWSEHVAKLTVLSQTSSAAPQFAIDRLSAQPVSGALPNKGDAKLVETLAFSPPADWSPQRRLEYVEFARRVVDGLRAANAFLEKQFDEAAKAAEKAAL
jgi:hypothetical protein